MLLVLVFLENGWAHVSKRDQMPFGKMIGAAMGEITVPLTGAMMLGGGAVIAWACGPTTAPCC